MVTYSRIHVLFDEAQPAPLFEVEDVDTESARIAVTVDNHHTDVAFTGTAGQLLTIAEELRSTLLNATAELGPECCLCGHRGMSWYHFAEPYGDGYHAHHGCVMDRDRARLVAEEERREVLVPTLTEMTQGLMGDLGEGPRRSHRPTSDGRPREDER